jgi:predicted phosphoadenosine phosphosulfate sulfurtransferase
MYSDAQWDVIVHHMRLRANITGQEQRAIVAFLKSAKSRRTGRGAQNYCKSSYTSYRGLSMIAHLSKPEYVHVLLNSLPVYGLILPLPAEELRRKVALSDIIRSTR